MSIRKRLHEFTKFMLEYEQKCISRECDAQHVIIEKYAKKLGFICKASIPRHTTSRNNNAVQKRIKMKPHIGAFGQVAKYKPAKRDRRNPWASNVRYLFDKNTNILVASYGTKLNNGSELSHLCTMAVQGRYTCNFYFYQDKMLVSYGTSFFGSANPGRRPVYPTELFVNRETKTVTSYKLYMNTDGENAFSGKSEEDIKRYERLPHKMKAFEWDMMGG